MYFGVNMNIKLIYILALSCLIEPFYGQTKERKIRFALMGGADLTSPVANLIVRGTTKYGGHVNLAISNTLYLTFDYGIHRGVRRNALQNQTFTYTNEGDYYILGVDYNLSRKKNNGSTFLGLRYGVSRFTNQLQYTIPKPYWQTVKTTFLQKSRPLEATWLGLVGGVRIQLVGPVYIGATARVRIIRDLEEGKINLTTTELPGFGFLTARTRATFTQYIFLRLGR